MLTVPAHMPERIGKYYVVHEVGRGSSGTVYLSHDPFYGRDVAIKELTLNPPTDNSKGLRIGNFPQIRDIVDEELESVWSGKKDAKTALDEAVKRGNEQLRKFEAANK